MKNNLKISIVTAVYNGEAYLEQCIESVKNQNYTNFEHIIVDGGSTDSTVAIIKKYEGTYNMKWISEKDKGMYDAICKGFRMATGDIFAWLNSDDIYLPFAFDTVASVMSQSEIKWCTGVPLTFSPQGQIYAIPKIIPVYPTHFLKKGYMDGRINSVIQQESTFWRKELWEKSGGLDSTYKYAGDYWLWVAFSKFEKLYTLDTVLAGFRVHEEQKSSAISRYYSEMKRFSLWKKCLSKTKFIKFVCYIRTVFRTDQFVKVAPFIGVKNTYYYEKTSGQEK